LTLVPDPLAQGGIAGYGRRLRQGAITAAAATEAYLERIAALDPKLGAYQHVAAEQALASARALDRLLAAGTDLGPLMGVPVAIKDIFAVDGMPTTAGSQLEVADLIGPEGPFVQALRRAGCVILGKVKTVEFALGAVGISRPRGTPWNPWDAAMHRIPGGSSSGPAVAVAAGLCGSAIGSDTGGSVRLPACFCGTFGLKTSWASGRPPGSSRSRARSIRSGR
jgi:aspartyl-tRNA(Asn)/glutamyl-tRNA(Gln) amidotransferase subunit A